MDSWGLRLLLMQVDTVSPKTRPQVLYGECLARWLRMGYGGVTFGKIAPWVKEHINGDIF